MCRLFFISIPIGRLEFNGTTQLKETIYKESKLKDIIGQIHVIQQLNLKTLPNNFIFEAQFFIVKFFSVAKLLSCRIQFLL